jgi:hypothetical protein
MEPRERRRALTEGYCLRALRRHRQAWHFQGQTTVPNFVQGKCYCTTNSLLWWAKRKAVGCRCKRKHNRHYGSPKVPGSLCHRGMSGYHPTVRSRIEARRACWAWLGAVALDDVEL